MLLPAMVLNSLLAGLGRFPLRNAVGCLSLVLRNVFLVLAVWSGGGLVAVGAALLASCTTDYLWWYLAAHHCSLIYPFRIATSTAK